MNSSRPGSFEDILARLIGARQSGDNWAAPCPLPGHRTPAGHLTLKDAGDKALITCQGGKHSYPDFCQAWGFDSLTYADNGSKPALAVTARLNDREAIAELKRAYGLTDATIEHFGIEPDFSRQAWHYPVKGGLRYKKYSRQPPGKYSHDVGTPNQLYELDEIPQGTTEVWLPNGEPAVWVMWQASVPATCGIYGEGQLPGNTIRELKEKGVQTINIPYDLDVPGKRAALKVCAELAQDFKLRVRQLPAHLGDKADVCDLFTWYGGDADAFREGLMQLADVDLSDDIECQEAVSLICMADVEAETVSWLWHPYIPVGKVTLVDGDPGIGKSWASLAMATAVSLGRGLPGAEATEPGKVVLASAEDGLGDTIRPRLDAMGANVKHIHAIKGALDFGNGGLALLQEYIERVRPVLVIIDPLVAYIGAGVDLHRANETRAVMARLAGIAEKYQGAIVVIRHLTKGRMLKPIYRGLGSIDITASCRSVLLAGCDPDNPQKRGLVHIKSNLAPVGAAIGYELRDGAFYWTGQSDLTAGRILSAEDGDGKTAIDEAVDFLRDELAEGPVEASQVWNDAGDAGLSEKTVKRAKARLRVLTRRQGETGKRGGGKFVWELPDGHLEDQRDLEGQEGHIKKSGPLNDFSLKNGGGVQGVDPLNPPNIPSDPDNRNSQSGQSTTDHRESILGMPREKALEIWRSVGASMIHLGPGENCLDLARLLYDPDVSERHLEAVRAWLQERITPTVMPT